MLLLMINAHKMSYNHGNYRVEGTHAVKKKSEQSDKNFVLEDRMKGNGGRRFVQGFKGSLKKHCVIQTCTQMAGTDRTSLYLG